MPDYQYYQPYLYEIRSKLFKALIAFALGFTIGIFRYQWILSKLMSVFNLKNINIVLVSPYQFINLAVSISILTGIIFTAPILAYEFLIFIKPALRPLEYRLMIKLLPIAAILFISGFAFGTWILQFVINIYVQTTQSFNINNLWDIESFLNQVIIMGTCMSVVFELPIVLTVLLRLHVIQRQTLIKQRRVAYAAMLIFDILLPTTDLLSDALIFAPLIILYEGTLLFNQERHLLPIANIQKSIKINQGGTKI